MLWQHHNYQLWMDQQIPWNVSPVRPVTLFPYITCGPVYRYTALVSWNPKQHPGLLCLFILELIVINSDDFWRKRSTKAGGMVHLHSHVWVHFRFKKYLIWLLKTIPSRTNSCSLRYAFWRTHGSDSSPVARIINRLT